MTYLHLGEKVREWRLASKLSVSGLARKVGTFRQNIENLEEGEVAQPRYAPALAKVMRVTTDELLDLRLPAPKPPDGGDAGDPIAGKVNASYNASPAVVEPKSVPLLAVPPDEHSVREPSSSYVASTGNVGPNGYALKVSGNSMLNPLGAPSFPDGCTIFVNPDLDCVPGKFVVATLGNGADYIFRRLIKEGNRLLLEPLNPRFEIEAMDASLRLVGVVVGAAFDVF